MGRACYILQNSFHGTSTRVWPKEKANGEGWIFLTDRQMRGVNRRLCKSYNCPCGGILRDYECEAVEGGWRVKVEDMIIEDLVIIEETKSTERRGKLRKEDAIVAILAILRAAGLERKVIHTIIDECIAQFRILPGYETKRKEVRR